MKNTKFIKVSTADRLPEKTGVYIIEKSSILMASWFNGLHFFRNAEIILVEYWLDERPDYEEEMKEMLERIVKTFETDYVVDGEIVDNPYEWLQDAYKDAKQLIKEATELE